MAGKPKNKYTDEQLINNLIEVADYIGHIPSTTEYNNCHIRIAYATTLQNRFGGWIYACEKAGLKVPLSQLIMITHNRKYVKENKEHIKERLLLHLYETAIQHPEEIHLCPLIEKYGQVSHRTYINYFGSTQKVIDILSQKFGINLCREHYLTVTWNKALIISEFNRIEKQLNKRPKLTELMQYSLYKNIQGGIYKLYGSYVAFLFSTGHHFNIYNSTLNAKNMKKQYCINLLRFVYKTLNEEEKLTITIKKIEAMCNIDNSTIIRLFGSTRNWFKAAKIPIPTTAKYGQKKTNEEIIVYLRKLVKRFGRIPSHIEYIKMPDKIVGFSTICIHFGSWNKALKAAGITSLREHHILSEQKMIESLQQLGKELGHTPTIAEYQNFSQKHGSITAFRKHFGSWNKALIKAGFKTINPYTNQQIIESLLKVKEYLNHIPSVKEYNLCPVKTMSSFAIYDRFGSWNQGLIAAGINLENLTKQKMIDSLKNIANNINQIPTMRAYNMHSLRICSVGTIKKYFGSWSKALDAAGLKEKSAS